MLADSSEQRCWTTGRRTVKVAPCAEPRSRSSAGRVAVEDVLDDREAEAGAALRAALARHRRGRSARSAAAGARARCRGRNRAPRRAPRACRPPLGRACSAISTRLPDGAVFQRVLHQILEHAHQFVAVARAPSAGLAAQPIATSTSRSRASVCSASATCRTIGDEIDRLCRAADGR